MNESERVDHLFYTKNVQPLHPIDLNVFLILTKISCSLIGIPLNVFLAIIIIRLRRLHSKPRNIFLLGIIFANLTAFVPALIELIYWNMPIESVCQAYVAVTGLPYLFLLLNTLFALGDRYVAITYPLWHREKVTVNRVICFLTLSILSLTFIIKFVYITGIAPLGCEIRFIHSKMVGWTMVILLVLCITIHFIVYRQTKNLLQESRNITHSINQVCSTDKSRQIFPDPSNGRIAEEEINLESNKSGPRNGFVDSREFDMFAKDAETSTPNQSTGMAIHMTSGVLRQMEMEATRTLIAGVASLFLMTCPFILFFLSVFFCRMITQSECSGLSSLAAYFKELGLVHAVYNPLVYLFRNDELCTVLKTKLSVDLRKV